MIKPRQLLFQKIAMFLLVGLTVVSALLGWLFQDTDFASQTWLLWLVWLTVAIKGQQITDIFMELSHAPRMWRLLFLSYVIILPIILGLIYWL